MMMMMMMMMSLIFHKLLYNCTEPKLLQELSHLTLVR